VAGVILEGGAFTRETSVFVWAILAASAPGLLVATVGRLYSSGFYALRDTRTPLRFSLVRIALSVTLGWVAAFPLPRALGFEPRWGVVGLTAASGLAGAVEYALLRTRLQGRIGAVGLPARFLVAVWGAATIAAGIAWAARQRTAGLGVLIGGLAVLAAFGVAYLVATLAFGVPEARRLVGRAATRLPTARAGQRKGGA
jgi:putative peptidoglycan lipid II flippase